MIRLARLLLIVALPLSPAVHSGDWPHLRGPSTDGRVAARGTFESEDVGLEVVWKVPLGSGYSGIAVAEGRAVTLFSDGKSDWVAAFDVVTGKNAWRHRVGDVHRGHDGSDDGPLSSPVIGGGRVFALSASGVLLALEMSDGKVAWTKSLVNDLGAKPPFFGFVTTPVLVDDVLAVQAGGSDGRAVVGLDVGTGETVWSHGDDEIQYQSPARMTLAGQDQIVAVGSNTITGLSPQDGAVLWTHGLDDGDHTGSANPTFIGDDRFLVIISGDAVAFRVSRTDDGHEVEELYRSKTLGGNYAPPVYHDGHVYGFRGHVLSCAVASTGERVWRSRPPGGDGVILVDEHLVVYGAKGNVVVVEATPDGYRERGRLEALDGSALTWPSFAGGLIYVRNLDEMAAVEVTRRVGHARLAGNVKPEHGFGRWVRSVETAEDPTAMVAEFLEDHPGLPIVEDDFVHFVYQGPVTDVSIAGSMNDSETAEPMERVQGTDLYYRSYRLEPGGRWEYRFQIDFENWAVDPRNPRSVPALEGDDSVSELVSEGYSVPTYLGPPDGPRGRVEPFTLSSEPLGYDKTINVWLPPGYDDDERAFPLLVVNDGDAWRNRGLMTNALDNLVGKSVAPVIVAFIDPYRRWWLEAGGSRTEDYVRMQTEELLPALQERYRIEDAPGSRAILGNRFYGVSAAYAALEHPDLFGGAAVQSVFLGLGAGHDLVEMIRQGTGSSVRFYLDWNRYDERNIDRGYDFAEDSKTLADVLESGGYSWQGGEVLDSYGWGGWRNRIDRMLVALFPME